MILLGYDVGSSFVRATLLDSGTGARLASATFPGEEMKIISRQYGWAEQDPRMWWENIVLCTRELVSRTNLVVDAIGVSAQMHGLVCVDSEKRAVRPCITWADSRAVPYGNRAFEDLGHDKCLSHILNSPGNFTISKLAWVKDNEPETYYKTDKVLLPADYVVMKLTGEVSTTVEGLSEGMLWDFSEKRPAQFLFDYFGLDARLVPPIVPIFGEQGRLSAEAASVLGLRPGIPVTYRSGDQPNSAFSLAVLNPGEVAATAGTSANVFGVCTDSTGPDPKSRVNTFAHVNYTTDNPRNCMILCLNGAGSFLSWVKRNLASDVADFDGLDALADSAPIGCDELTILPFGNGSERLLGNRDVGCQFRGLNFNIHSNAHIIRAGLEGIVFTLQYGIEIMKGMGIDVNVIHAPMSRMFRSRVFRQTFADVSGATIEFYDTDGSVGAAQGAGVGAGAYGTYEEVFSALNYLGSVPPNQDDVMPVIESYARWRDALDSLDRAF